MSTLDLPESQLLLRRKRAAELAEVIRQRDLTPEVAACKTGATIHQINRILAGDADTIPASHLTDFLSRLTGKTICSCG